jgi:GxxExxY protein
MSCAGSGVFNSPQSTQSARRYFLRTAETEDEAEYLNGLTEKIIHAAIEVHKALGPGLLESTYRTCTAYELIQAKLQIAQEVSLPIIYKGIKLDAGYRLDMIVNDAVIVKFKSVEALAPIHDAQLLSYLKLSGLKVGLLLNFNVKVLKYGIHRIVNHFPETQKS